MGALLSSGPEPRRDSQQLHLDFTVPDIDAAQAEVLTLDATALDRDT